MKKFLMLKLKIFSIFLYEFEELFITLQLISGLTKNDLFV